MYLFLHLCSSTWHIISIQYTKIQPTLQQLLTVVPLKYWKMTSHNMEEKITLRLTLHD